MTDRPCFARPGEEDQLIALYRACFPEDGPEFWRWLLAEVARPEDILVIREEGRVVSSLQMLPCGLTHGGAVLPVHYIYAAATLPARQGAGLMGRLLGQAAREGLRRGHQASLLITQEDSLMNYYARFGYQSRLMTAICPPVRLPAEGCGGRRPARSEDIPTLDLLYQRAAGSLPHGHRPQAHWMRQLTLFGGGAAVWQREGEITAYAFADERGVLEAVGPDSGLLAAAMTPGQPWRTLPGADGRTRPIGCVKPLTPAGRALLKVGPIYWNLMYN